jgi:hypothetical protein
MHGFLEVIAYSKHTGTSLCGSRTLTSPKISRNLIKYLTFPVLLLLLLLLLLVVVAAAAVVVVVVEESG